ncbi:MAG: CHAD domain-containing protein [Actinobacteria bacterium]|nr:MAG: CHAD domain-containing protein [Actinomycetota bacterium]
MSRSVEQELKLLAPDELLLPRFDDLGLTPGPPESRVLVATYLDTPDLRLARSGASLRWRDDEACWVVKLPSRSASDVLTRDTYGFDGPLSTPAPAAVKLVTAIVRRVPLDVVARLTTRRTRIPLCDPHGKAVLEIDDDRVEAETMNGPVTFREIEAELLADDSSDRVLDDIRGRLQAVGAQKSDGLPKIVRALGERARRPPDVDPAARVPRAPTVEQVLGYALASSVAQLILHDPGTRTGEDPEDVHKARVATRRLRSHLRTFRSHLDQRWASALQDDLRWLGRAFGQVRDVEVLRERLVADAVNHEPQDHAAFGTVLALLDDQWRTARAHLSTMPATSICSNGSSMRPTIRASARIDRATSFRAMTPSTNSARSCDGPGRSCARRSTASRVMLPTRSFTVPASARSTRATPRRPSRRCSGSRRAAMCAR